MTSISATTNSSYLSPLQKLQDELQAETNSGAISSSDQTALSSALTDINSSLQNSAASDQSSGSNSSPGDLKSKIDNLIAGEVSSGKLTSDQATELQGVFKAAFANGDAGGSGAPARSAPPRLVETRPALAVQARSAARIMAITAAMAVPRPRTVRPRPTAQAVHRTPAPPMPFCSNFCSRCRIPCPARHLRPTARPARPVPATPAVRLYRF
jgi:hypothetical protein